MEQITLDHPASHRLNSGSDWPSSRCGEGSVGAVRTRSDLFLRFGLESTRWVWKVLDSRVLYPRFVRVPRARAGRDRPS